MIFLPNKFDKYTASLRCLMQRLILKNCLKERYLRNLRIIYEAEALKQNILLPININDEYTELLTAVYFKKLCNNLKFNYYLNVKQNYILNNKLFKSLILNICSNTSYIEIFEIEKKIIIKSRLSFNAKTKFIINKLNGILLTERKNGISLIIFKFNQTDKITEDFEDAYSLLQNPLSTVNLYLYYQ